jgi:hypothetical protein
MEPGGPQSKFLIGCIVIAKSMNHRAYFANRLICPPLFLLYFFLPVRAQDLRGVVDLHAHCSPDVVPRSIDGVELARLAWNRGFRGIVLKNHYEPTATLAALARKAAPGLEVFGGIALNRAVGGINPAAVERMANVEGAWGRVVWMPTFDAENQVRTAGEKRPFVPISRDGSLLPEVLEVIRIAAKRDMIFATGHSTPAEVLLLVKEARRLGVRRILVTHGMLAPVSMTAAEMRQAADAGAWIEFVSLALLRGDFGYKETVAAMRAVGVEQCILTSDLGQKDQPLHPDGLARAFAGLREAGMAVAEIERMVKRNPAELLGLP